MTDATDPTGNFSDCRVCGCLIVHLDGEPDMCDPCRLECGRIHDAKTMPKPIPPRHQDGAYNAARDT